MEEQLSFIWQDRLKHLDIAFQPIVNFYNGELYGVEALLRNYLDIGFNSIFSVFDAAFRDGVLYAFDLALRKKVLKKFTQIHGYEKIKLFYNLDNRVLQSDNYSKGNTKKILKQFGLPKEMFCFEISERHEISSRSELERLLIHYKESNYKIAIDDFGMGYSGYKLLFDVVPDIIKIDRFFITSIQHDYKRKLMVRSITHLAIELGIEVLAEGIETQEEFLACKEIGCSMAQGYFVQHPTIDPKDIKIKYKHIKNIFENDRRDTNFDSLNKHIQHIKPLHVKTKMAEVIEYFKKNQENPYIPIINDRDEPIGILSEAKIKEYLYSPYGMSLLLNKDSEKSKLSNFVDKCPVVNIQSGISMIVNIFSHNSDAPGIILTDNSKYFGFLLAGEIVKVIHEESLLLARDQNPLTKLPGNRLIEEFIYDINKKSVPALLCYFDLNNFKAYNDKYGFRNGDRVIQLFANILEKELPKEYFKGHIGGDDFFIGLKIYNQKSEDIISIIKKIIKRFENDVIAFYDKKDIKNGFITAKDRDGNKKKFSLLSVSASVIFVNISKNSKHQQAIDTIFAIEKKVAKNCVEHIAMCSLL